MHLNRCQHLQSTTGIDAIVPRLQPSITFARPQHSAFRFDRQLLPNGTVAQTWEDLEGSWRLFWKSLGSEQLGPSNQVDVGGEHFLTLGLVKP